MAVRKIVFQKQDGGGLFIGGGGDFTTIPNSALDAFPRIRVKFCAFDFGLAIELSPWSHPAMRRVLASFEPCWLGGATGRGAEPSM
jgi:hypothetical protein